MFDEVRRRCRRRAALVFAVLFLPSLVVAALVGLLLALGLATPAGIVSDDAYGVAVLVLFAAFGAVALATPSFVALAADRVVPWALRARPAEEFAEGARLEAVTEALALAAGTLPPRVLVVDSPAVNAASLGRGGPDDRGVVLVTTGALRRDALPEPEREALLALCVSDLATGGAAISGARLAAGGGLLLPAATLARLNRRRAALIVGAALLVSATGVYLRAEGDATLAERLVFLPLGVAGFAVLLAFTALFCVALAAAVVVALSVLALPAAGEARRAATVGAVQLTRYGPAAEQLWARVPVLARTRVSWGPLGSGLIWVLPWLLRQAAAERRLRWLRQAGAVFPATER